MSEQQVPYQAGEPAEKSLLCMVCGEGAGDRGAVLLRVVEVQREILMGDRSGLRAGCSSPFVVPAPSPMWPVRSVLVRA